MQTRTTRRLLSVALGAMLAMGTVATAFADGGGDASGTINGTGSSATEADAGTFTFATKSIGATDSSTALDLDLTVNDLTGTGAGWALQMSMTQFTCNSTNTPNCGTQKLPKTSVLNVSSECSESSTCVTPLSSAHDCGIAADAAVSDVTSAFDLCVADPTTGMGSIAVAPVLSVPVLSDAYAGEYDSTVTITFVVS